MKVLTYSLLALASIIFIGLHLYNYYMPTYQLPKDYRLDRENFSHIEIRKLGKSYKDLLPHGIVSGFGIRQGDALNGLDNIKSINKPRFISVDKSLYPPEVICVGIKIGGNYFFAPKMTLNNYEIVNFKDKALAFCPLAGLSIAPKGTFGVSGLLKYDAFVLFDKQNKNIVLPYSQEYFDSSKTLSLNPVQELNFKGILKKFSNAKILDPKYYRHSPNAYGDYPTSNQMGLHHPKPGLKKPFDFKKMKLHPKDKVLIIGNQKLEKGYLIKTLKELSLKNKLPLEDSINGMSIKIYYDESCQWAYALNDKRENINMAFSYLFALKQHLPDLKIYSVDSTN